MHKNDDAVKFNLICMLKFPGTYFDSDSWKMGVKWVKCTSFSLFSTNQGNKSLVFQVSDLLVTRRGFRSHKIFEHVIFVIVTVTFSTD